MMQPIFKWIVFVVLSLVILFLGTALALVLTMPDLPSAVTNNELCLPSENGYLGCGKTTDVLQEYLDRAITGQYAKTQRDDEMRQREYLNNRYRIRLLPIYDYSYYLCEKKPAAKLTGKEQPKPRKEDSGAEMTPIRVWRNGREHYDTSGFERYGVRYRNGRLVVPVSGTYFVYSFVNLFERCDPSTGKPNIKDTSKPLKHGIFKFNILDEEELEIVSNVQPHTVSSNRYFNSYSSYVSTLAELKAGDELSVKVSNITYIKYTRDNYFGLNLI